MEKSKAVKLLESMPNANVTVMYTGEDEKVSNGEEFEIEDIVLEDGNIVIKI